MKARAGGTLPVFVVLTRQPHPEIIARVHGTVEPRMRAAESEYYGLTSRGSAPADQLQAARARLSSVIVEARQESFRQIEADIRPDQDQVEAELLGLGAIDIERYSVLNMVRADIPASALPALEADPLIASVSLVEERKLQLKDSVPYLWFGAGGGQIPVGPVNYTGRGQTVAILDTGIKTTHRAFRELMAAGGIPAKAFVGHLQNPCPADLGTTEDLQGHGTHVAGIVASEGGTEILPGFDSTEYKGVAPSVSLVNLKVAARTQTPNGCTGGTSNDDDVFSAIQWGLGLNDARVTPITVFNYSFGGCTSDGAGGCSDEDTKTSQIFDSIADYWGVTIVVAAGNDGAMPAPGCALTSRSVNDPGIAYNILSVANLNMKVVPLSPNRCPPPNPGISPKSSKGPTAATAAYPIGRRKPDIAAPGTYIYSAAFNFDVAGKPQFVTKSGTSMAAPHIAGAVAVLQNRAEVHLPPSADCFLQKTARLNTLTANTLSIKALLLNSANFGPGASGWMADSGWGWASLSKAINQLDLAATKGGSAIAISCVQTPVQNPPPNTLPRHYRFFKGPIQATAANAFKATLAWNRHIVWGPVDQLTNPVWSQSGSPNPVVPAEPSHLRLRLYDIATNNRLDADPPDNDPRNNVQQLVSTQSGTEVVKVYREAGFGPDQQEPFALALSQPLTPAAGPALGLSCGANVDNNTHAVTLLCSVTNTGDLPLFNVAVQTAGGGACQFQVGAQTVPAFPTLNPLLPVSCSMPFPGTTPVTVNANGVFADEPFSATTVVVPPNQTPADCHGVTLNPVQATAGADGGPGTFDVILPDPAKCSVRSVDVPPQIGWISASIGADFSGGTHIQYSVFPLNPPPPPHFPTPPPNPPRSGIIEVVLKDYTSRVFNIDQSGAVTPCMYTATAAPAAFTYNGGPGTMSITPNLAACTWTATAVEPYVLPPATNGQGTQVVPFTVGPNTKPDASTLARSVTLHVTGQNSFAQTFALTQAGLTCTFALSNVPQPVSADGSPGIIVTVTPSSVDCQWTAQSPVNWIQIVGGAIGKGVGPVTLAVAANAGDVRTATLTIAGQPFMVKQAAHCTFNLLPVADPVPAGGNTGITVNVTASWPSCGWTAQSPVTWIAILAGAVGQGNGSTRFSVAANPGVARSTALPIAGLPYPIHQDAGIQQFQLLTAVSPAGAGTVTPASGNFYHAGTVVPLTATPAAGFVFAGWTGQVAASASATTTVSMSGPQSVTAKFISQQPITVGVSPGAAFLSASQQMQFSAVVRGAANQQVTWSMSLVSGGGSPLGSITKGGLYTAPSLIAVPQIVKVTATSAADPTKTGSATVHLAPLTVTVAPAMIALHAGDTHQFNAIVHAGTNNHVRWSVPAGVGTVTQNGAYTAPARVNTRQVITVVATSIEDPTKSGLATITLMP